MGYTLQQLSDIEELTLVKHRYFRSIDTAEMALLDPLFTEADIQKGDIDARSAIALKLRQEAVVVRAQGHAAVIVPHQRCIYQVARS